MVTAATGACRARGLKEAPLLVAAVLDALSEPAASTHSSDLRQFASVNDLTLRAARQLAEEVRRAADPERAASTVIDIVAVTALALEGRAVESFLVDVVEVIHPVTGTIYRVGHLRSANSTLGVAVVVASDGNPAAASETERAISYFKPAVAVFVGVAGGLKDDIQRGDVVAASYVYDYSAAKEGAEFIQSRVKSLPASYAAQQRALSLAATGDWVRLAATSPAAAVARDAPRAFVKPIAAGPKLIATSDGPTAQWIRLHCGDALAVEMEGFGFHTATHAHPSTQAIVVRGISDCVDDKASAADQHWQPIAASRAAAFALALAAALTPTATSRS